MIVACQSATPQGVLSTSMVIYQSATSTVRIETRAQQELPKTWCGEAVDRLLQQGVRWPFDCPDGNVRPDGEPQRVQVEPNRVRSSLELKPTPHIGGTASRTWEPA